MRKLLVAIALALMVIPSASYAGPAPEPGPGEPGFKGFWPQGNMQQGFGNPSIMGGYGMNGFGMNQQGGMAGGFGSIQTMPAPFGVFGVEMIIRRSFPGKFAPPGTRIR